MDYQYEQFLPEAGNAEAYSVLDEEGKIRKGASTRMSIEQTIESLKLMLLTRAFDEKAFRLNRQGRFGTFSQVTGQEAAIAGSAAALDPGRDWVVPQYRELPALLRQGYPLENFILYFMGNPKGGAIPPGVNCLPLNISLASQVPHAVGLAWGLAQQAKSAVVITYFGDGASSEGDVHEAMNLAGVLKAPVIFFLSNNGWAISTPRERQSAARSLAVRAVGYGMPGVLVDGNDLLAVHDVTAAAVERGLRGEGPTVIEAITYRVGAHNTADDPTRYVDESVRQQWIARDPIERVRRYLTAQQRWSVEIEEQTINECRAEVESALERANANSSTSINQLFEHLYADPPARMVEQQRIMNQRF
jgi:pyruvate dehydrogenase E1 component alpha subunit